MRVAPLACYALSFVFCAVLLAGCSGSSPSSQGLPAGSIGQTGRIEASGGTIVFNGRSFKIGSAAAQARAIQARAKMNIVLPPGALYVADPSLNGVMVYDEFSTGAAILPYGILAGPKSQLNGPVAVAVGTDLPCNTTGVCTQYLWVSNAGNNTISAYTLPLGSWNQAPAGVITYSGTGACGPGISNPYGIAHYGPFGTSTSGTILQTSETAVSSTKYYIVGFQANLFGLNPCNVSFTSPNYDSPSGPSIYYGLSASIFNANRDTVTSQVLSPGLPPGIGPPGISWALPHSAATEGTAIQQGTTTGNSYVWTTTSADTNYPNDALWRCQIKAFTLGTCVSARGGGAAPVCVNPGVSLDDPAFPATSTRNKWIYAPNIGNGTVTAYRLRVPCTLKSTFVNLVTPFGVAVQF
jgi:hypothetical protein